MKYLMMVLGTQADYEGMRGKASEHAPAWTPEQLQAMYAHMGAINDDLAETGEMIDGQGLAEPARTRFVTAGADGKPVVTDGPYPETKELLMRLLAPGLREPGPGHGDRGPRRPVPRPRGAHGVPGGHPAGAGGSGGHLSRRKTVGQREVRQVGMNEVEGLLRRCAPQVLGALVRRYGHFYAAEDAVQEALLTAAGQWPHERSAGQSARVADQGGLAAADGRVAR